MTEMLGVDMLRERLEIHPIFEWDESKIGQVEVEYHMNENGMSENEAIAYVYSDSCMFDHEWEWFIDRVQEWLDNQNTDVFYISARGVGWRNLSGYKISYPDNAEEFIKNLVGFNCQYTLRCFESETSLLHATVYHHDSPTGESREVYNFKDYTAEGVKSFSIQSLQKFLTGWLEANEGSWHYLTEQYEIDDFFGDKSRRNYTKNDFVDLIWEMYQEETLSEDETLKIEETIAYYMEVS